MNLYVKKTRDAKHFIYAIAAMYYLIALAAVACFILTFNTLFVLLAAPYILKFVLLIFLAIKNRSASYIFVPYTDIVFALGFLAGLLEYFMNRRSLSRG